MPVTGTTGAITGCRRSSAFWGLGCPKTHHEIKDSLIHTYKDAYWSAVNYGVVDESRHLGVKMCLVEAGGHTNLTKHISQNEDCVVAGADAVVIGAISFDGMNNQAS